MSPDEGTTQETVASSPQALNGSKVGHQLADQPVEEPGLEVGDLGRILERYVIKRPGQPDEIAHAALYLTSDEPSFVSGAALAVDGGRTFH
jgi:NAD(P)-dependent dehydrogenase (short-subunit alcohol dehydrogenase family)